VFVFDVVFFGFLTKRGRGAKKKKCNFFKFGNFLKKKIRNKINNNNNNYTRSAMNDFSTCAPILLSTNSRYTKVTSTHATLMAAHPMRVRMVAAL